MSDNNPGGSLGDEKFPMPEINTYSQLQECMFKYHGYESSNNLFFKEKIRGLRIAEVGCGHGFSTLILAQFVSSISGFDVDENAILRARSLSQKLQISNADFLVLNEKLNFIESYDAAISMDVIEHVHNPVSYLRMVNAMVKKGGRLFLGTPNGLIANKNKCLIKMHSQFHIMEYSPEELITFLRDAKFNPVGYYCNKNISGKGYDIPILKKTVVKFLCRMGLLDMANNILNRNRKGIDYETKTSGNSIKDWIVKPIEPDDINAHNCDVIIIEAVKE